MAGVKFLEIAEVQALLDQPNTRSVLGLRNRCIMGLMYECGLRVSEALSLKPRDVNILEKRVEILRGKGAKPRTVYFRSVALGELIERWKRLRTESDYLFCVIRGQGRGQQVSVRNIENAVAFYGREAGLTIKARPHLLRHSWATHELRKGTNIRVIQAALGHKNLQTTMVYTHLSDSDVRVAMRGY